MSCEIQNVLVFMVVVGKQFKYQELNNLVNYIICEHSNAAVVGARIRDISIGLSNRGRCSRPEE